MQNKFDSKMADIINPKNHDKANNKYSYIFEKWPVTYQFRV